MTKELTDSLPSVVRVAGFDIKIQFWDMHAAASVQRWGEFSSIEQMIRIQRDMPSRFKLADTVLHEIGHAIFWAYDLEDEDKEERIVSTFATAWMTLYRDNPLLLPWLQRALA